MDDLINLVVARGVANDTLRTDGAGDSAVVLQS